MSVTATDLVGYTNTKEVAATTAPAPPTVSSSTQSFCSLTLNWTTPVGAAYYKLYDARTATPVLITTTNNTFFIVNGLTSGTTYKFFAKAHNSSGLESDAGNLLSVSTLTIPVPVISGSSSICSSGTSFTVTNLPAGCGLEWSQGQGLSLYSTSGNTAIFKATGNTETWIKATINPGCGIKSKIYSVDAGSPKPGNIFIDFDTPPKRFTASIAGMVSATSYKWYLDGVLKFNTPEEVVIFQRQLNNCGHIYNIDVAMVNVCGISPLRHTEVSEPPCNNFYSVYPNPATSEISINQNADISQLSVTTENYEPKMIQSIKIIDNSGLIVISKKYPNETQEVSLNISGLKAGNYQIIINEGDDQESHMLIKY